MLFDDTLLDDGQDEALIQAADQGERQAQHQIQLGGNPLATQRGRFRFVPEPLHERRSQKFGVHERVVRLRPCARGSTHPSTTVGRRSHTRATTSRRTSPRSAKGPRHGSVLHLVSLRSTQECLQRVSFDCPGMAAKRVTCSNVIGQSE